MTNTSPVNFHRASARFAKGGRGALHQRTADRSTIPFGCFLISFEPVPPIANPPVIQYTPIPKDNRLPAMPRPQTRWPF